MVTGWDTYFMDMEAERERKTMAELQRVQDGITRLRTLMEMNGGSDADVLERAFQEILKRDQKITGLYETIAERNHRIRTRAAGPAATARGDQAREGSRE